MIVVELFKALPSILNAIWTVLKTLPGLIWGILKTVISRFSEWGSSIREKARNAISQLVSNVVAKAKELPGKIWSAIVGAVSKIGQWGSQLLSKAKTAIKNVASAITDGLKSVPSKLGSIGKDLVKGLWNGIKNMTSWIKDKIKGFGSSVVDGLKDFFGIKSPSRLFRDEIGRYIAEGIGVGVADNADKPLTALKELGEEMADQDLALNGATINRKLSTTFSVAGGVDAISTNEAILNKLDTLADKISRLKMVLNNGVLVGELLDDIDSRLADKQLLSVRGV
jgi:phage-related protein